MMTMMKLYARADVREAASKVRMRYLLKVCFFNPHVRIGDVRIPEGWYRYKPSKRDEPIPVRFWKHYIEEVEGTVDIDSYLVLL